MLKKKELSRLGDILVNKGLITQTQLKIAIREQTARKLNLDPADIHAQVAPIGEILIELGFIDRLQLKRGLNWQLRLRHASIAMALCAPFMSFTPAVAAATVVRPAMTVEAENYTTMAGVENQGTVDVGGGQNVGYIDTGDWMTYNNINIATNGTYKITFRVASMNGGGKIQLRSASDTVLGGVAVPSTGGWQNWTEVEQTVKLNAGIQSLKIYAEAGGYNLNWFKIENITEEPVEVISGASFSQKIEAESFSKMSGVDTQSTGDVDGGSNVGWIDTGDWMNYENAELLIPLTGKYKITYRVASAVDGGTIQLKNLSSNVTIDTVPIPNSGDWQKWIDVERVVTLGQGLTKLQVLAEVGGFNLNWIKVESIEPEIVAPTMNPIEVRAENYSSMAGIQTEATKDTGGGNNVGWIETGDWLAYSNLDIPIAGTYKITYRVASPNSSGNIALKSGTDVVLGMVDVPNTGGWQSWQDVQQKVDLTAGKQSLKILAESGGFNFNWFKIELVNAASSNMPPEVILPETSFPLVVQAEKYSSMVGMKTETTTDVGGGKNLGSMDAGDTVSYANTSVNVPFTGKYKISYRVASLRGGASLVLNDLTSTTTLDTIAVAATGGWQNWTTIEREITLTKGEHKFSILAKASGANLNWFKIEPVITPMPLTVQAESYNAMNGVINETTTDIGGGLSVGYLDTDDWMIYSNSDVLIPNTSGYKLTYRVASEQAGGSFKLQSVSGDTVFDSVIVPNSGGWQKWVNVERIITLPAGKHNFGIKVTNGGFNLNWFKLEPVNSSGQVISSSSSSVSSSSSSSKASSVASSSSAPASIVSSSSISSSSSKSSSSASSTPSTGVGSVAISWTAPKTRENGTYLDITELGGYEIRYKKAADSKYTYVSINDPWTTSYYLDSLDNTYVFQIAAFDKEGVYSSYVDVARQ